MNKLFFVRNLMSANVAGKISDIGDGNDFFLLMNNATANHVASFLNRNRSRRIFYFDEMKLKFDINLISVRNIVKSYKKEVASFLSEKKINEVYLTYPLHFDSYVFFECAAYLEIPVTFYEEGPCFYRRGRTKQYSNKSFLNLVKGTFFRLIKLKRGYDFNPSNWVCSMPIPQPHDLISLTFEFVEDFIGVKKLFLSRPASDDFKNISINDEIKAIEFFITYSKSMYSDEPLYIKFHPREGVVKRDKIISHFNSKNIQIIVIDLPISSEDVLYSMKEGIVCGFDTTTLVYSKIINTNVKPFSVLRHIKSKDKSGFLDECFNEYVNYYSYIKMI